MKYDELVTKLRTARTVSIAWEGLMNDAAAAIEALQDEVERLKDSNEELRERQTFIDHYGTEWMTSAKDVPTAAYEHGYADGLAEVKAQLQKRGELTADEVETIRIHMNAIKERLCNQNRHNEAEEYQVIVDKLAKMEVQE